MCPISFLAELAISPPHTWDKTLTQNHQQQQKQCWVVHMLVVRGLKLARSCTHTSWPPPQNQSVLVSLPFYRVHMQECSLEMELAVHPVCHALYFSSNPYLFCSPLKKCNSMYIYVVCVCVQREHHLWLCSECEPAQIFLTSKFSYCTFLEP
jgi:hypothetical protein